ncbi:MAG: Fe-S cluster assembly protein SufD [Rhodothermales bacterium]
MSNTTQDRNLEKQFVTAFESNVGRTLNGTNTKLRTLRTKAIEQFEKMGFPARKDEAWKYTNIGDVLTHDFQVRALPPFMEIDAVDLEPFAIPGLDAHLVVLVNGRFSQRLSNLGDVPDGVIIESLESAGETHGDLLETYFGRYAHYDEEVFTALNTAFTVDGLFLYVPKGHALEKPVHVINVQKVDEDLFLQPRNLFVFEENAQAKIVETSVLLGGGRTFTNAVSEVHVGERAVVDYYLLQDQGDEASLVTNTNVYQKGSSVFTAATVTLSGDVIRNNMNVLPDAAHCETHLYGLFLSSGTTHVDNHTHVDHAKPDCESNELYKGVLDDQSTGVFNGKVFVRQDAQRINAFQENKSILLTKEATMNSKPELEIYADDVKCSHGATTGQLDREALFYLRSRGLPANVARGMLLHAFAGDVIEKVRVEPLRRLLDKRVSNRFGW